jgi:hypothetical protein
MMLSSDADAAAVGADVFKRFAPLCFNRGDFFRLAAALLGLARSVHADVESAAAAAAGADTN